ncbi:MAG TPA: 4-(cytidine 5'-diphospho)-2-C-methyl-D-erythritol kinase, partial [Stackebrandtia sp.]|nr:4-(cytidine 5'-diphospho)-2-C-methyl-D-erythritol kinase [Stackebrandtia sp.]
MSEALAYESESDAVRVRVPAKINLHLGVGPRRADGYHDLTTVYQAISLYDEVTVERDERQGIHVEVEGTGAGLVPLDDSNLAVRAVRLLGLESGIKPEVTVRIDKSIPVAGGLAGGSADAAGALLAAARLWDL